MRWNFSRIIFRRKCFFERRKFNSVVGVFFLFLKLSMTRRLQVCRVGVFCNTSVGCHRGSEVGSAGFKSRYRSFFNVFFSYLLTCSYFLQQKVGFFFIKNCSAYVMCKKNYSFKRAVFFFQSKIANSFHSKNDSNGIRTTGFSSSSSFCRAIFFLISLTFVKNSIPMVPIAQWVRQQGSEAKGPGSWLCRAKYFYDFTGACQKTQWFPWHSG